MSNTLTCNQTIWWRDVTCWDLQTCWRWMTLILIFKVKVTSLHMHIILYVPTKCRAPSHLKSGFYCETPPLMQNEWAWSVYSRSVSHIIKRKTNAMTPEPLCLHLPFCAPPQHLSGVACFCLDPLCRCYHGWVCMHACVRACMCAFVRACICPCVHACVCPSHLGFQPLSQQPLIVLLPYWNCELI